jgi:hypothetical protein
MGLPDDLVERARPHARGQWHSPRVGWLIGVEKRGLRVHVGSLARLL